MGFLDSLGAASPGDGYVDPTTTGNQGSIVDFIKSLLGPTQSQAQAGMTGRDLANQAQIIPYTAPAPDDGSAASATQPLNAPTAQPPLLATNVGTQGPSLPRVSAIPQQLQDAQSDAQKRGEAEYWAATNDADRAATAQALGYVPQNPPPGVQAGNPPDIQIAQAQGQPDVNVNGDGSTTNANTIPPSGNTGLLASLQQGAQDPNAAKSILQEFADKAKTVGDRLSSLSPSASQALIASGLTMLANNDGTKNLSQLVGQGGIAGVNAYTTQNQVAAQNQLARQKLAQDLWEKQQNLQLEYNKPTTVAPGNGIITPAMSAAGQGPTSGGPVIAKEQNYVDNNGVKWTQPVDAFGRAVGQPYQTENPNVGPLPADRLKIVNDASDAATAANTSLGKYQNYIQKLSPTVTDPASGKQVPNPNYVNVPGGLVADAQNAWTKVTGDQTAAQQLRNEISQNITTAGLSTYKAGVGGRLTNADINLLQKGLPSTTASGDSLRQYLVAYGHLQEDQAMRANAQAAYLAQNRGDSSPLKAPLTFGGKTFPAGTTMQQVELGQGAVQSQGGNGSQPAKNAPQPAQNVVQQAIAAARAGDPNAQAALRKRQISW